MFDFVFLFLYLIYATRGEAVMESSTRPQQSLPPNRQHQPASVGRKLCEFYFEIMVFLYIQCTWRGQFTSEKAFTVHGVLGS